MAEFKKPVPESRTIVNGIWSDILDCWQAAFETSDRGTTALGVFVQDQTTPVLTVPFLNGRSALALAVDVVSDGINRDIIVVDATGVIIGDTIEIANPTTRQFMQADVTAVISTTITLDQPINQPYTTTNSSLQLSDKNMLVDGSVTPQIFSVLPLPEQSGDMVRIIIEIRGSAGGAMDFTTFGSETSLANGCVIRVNNGDGTYRNLFNFKSNSDYIEQGFDFNFLDPKGGNTIPGFVSRVTWGGQSKHGVVIRLEGSLGQSLEVVIQDDLTVGNTRFHLTAQGHEIQG